MSKNIQLSLLLSCLALTACGVEDPAFKSVSLGKYQVAIADDPADLGGAGDKDFVYDAYSGPTEALSVDSLVSLDADASSGTASGDATPGSGANSGSGANAGSGADGSGKMTAEQERVARTCAPHFAGIGARIRVLEANQPDQAIAVTAETVIAMHLKGNDDKLVLNLGASAAGMAGLCLLLTGENASVEVNSASSFQKLVFVGRSKQSQGFLNMTQGASIAATNIELTGSSPSLTVTGVAEGTCDGAKLQGSSPSLSCGL